MTSARWFGGILLAIAAGLAPQLVAQLQTDVPPPVAGARPVTVEHIKEQNPKTASKPNTMCLPNTPGKNPGGGHFYLAKNRTFLLCVDMSATSVDQAADST